MWKRELKFVDCRFIWFTDDTSFLSNFFPLLGFESNAAFEVFNIRESCNCVFVSVCARVQWRNLRGGRDLITACERYRVTADIARWIIYYLLPIILTNFVLNSKYRTIWLVYIICTTIMWSWQFRRIFNSNCNIILYAKVYSFTQWLREKFYLENNPDRINNKTIKTSDESRNQEFQWHADRWKSALIALTITRFKRDEATESGRQQQQQLLRRIKSGRKKTSLILLRPSQGYCRKMAFFAWP